jgi:hypothetical protein
MPHAIHGGGEDRRILSGGAALLEDHPHQRDQTPYGK